MQYKYNIVMEKNSEFVRDFMASLARPVVVLSVLDQDNVHGFTLSSLTSLSVSEHNPQVVFTIRKESFFGSLLRNCLFGISVLSDSQPAESEMFARPRKPLLLGPDLDAWILTDTGVPLLREAVSSAVAKVTKTIDFEDNNLFVATLSQTTTSTYSRPLVYADRAYYRLQELNPKVR